VFNIQSMMRRSSFPRTRDWLKCRDWAILLSDSNPGLRGKHKGTNRLPEVQKGSSCKIFIILITFCIFVLMMYIVT